MIEKHYRMLYLVKPEWAYRYPPIYRTDSAEFPHLLDYIEDESTRMVLDLETQEFYPVGEFFYMIRGIVEFITKQLPEDDPRIRWSR